jgi:hypothetical protein
MLIFISETHPIHDSSRQLLAADFAQRNVNEFCVRVMMDDLIREDKKKGHNYARLRFGYGINHSQ